MLDRTQARHRALLARLDNQLAYIRCRCLWVALTLQNLSLRNVCLTGTLQTSSIDEVKNNAIRKLLSILVWGVWRAEVAEVEALSDALLVVLRGAEDEVAQSVDFDPASFPELSHVSVYDKSLPADYLPKCQGTGC